MTRLNGKPKKLRVTVEAEFGPKIAAEAWRYQYKRHNEVYVQVKDATGAWSAFRILVPR